jgi:DMSO/TMAO reductase YedYZ molybdopterin-dependent catalytic subunit
MENKKLNRVLPIIIVMVALILFVALILAAMPSGVVPLNSTEVHNYQGENLSAINQVYENAIAGTQHINTETYYLNISGDTKTPLLLKYSDVVNGHQSYLKVVTIYCVEGWNAKILWEGALVSDLLRQARANMNDSTVIFRAQDGYSTALPMSYIVNNNILLAYKINNVTLPDTSGFPFMLVAESQYGYKWIKWLTSIEVSNNVDYLGYWESRGYPNNAAVP